jgi:NADPH-dependent ferric siderophore reductase
VRNQAGQGRRLVEELRRFLGLGALDPTALPEEVPTDLDVEVWETRRYSSSGEEVAEQVQRPTVGSGLNMLHAWIAGESWLDEALRRSLVTELNVDRAQIAFMGYWPGGVSMKS